MVGEGEVGEEEEDVFEVELASVNDVSFALRFAVGFEALEFESIPVPTTLTKRLFGHGGVGSGGWLIQGQQIVG